MEAFVASLLGSVRVYGGSRGYAEPGCELADFGEPFASSVEANNWLHFLYATAEEAFAVEEVRVQLCLYHGFPVRQVQWVTNPGPNARAVMPFAGSMKEAQASKSRAFPNSAIEACFA